MRKEALRQNTSFHLQVSVIPLQNYEYAILLHSEKQESHK